MRNLDLPKVFREMQVRSEETQVFVASWPELPQLEAYGKTPDEARSKLMQLLDIHYADLAECCSSEPAVEED